MIKKLEIEKRVLPYPYKGYIPEEVTNGIKQGFSAPDASWFRGESIEYVRDTLYNPRARIYDFFDRNATLALVDEHLSGKVNRRLLIWSLLYLEEWCHVFLEGKR
jgi:asparagine synthase (glutamine-hydrolysing)